MNSRPDILFVTHRVPYPPDKGDRIRTYHLLRFLSEHARVHLASLADETPTDQVNQTLAGLCHRVAIVPREWGSSLRGLRSLALGGTISEGVFRSAKLSTIIESWCGDTNFVSAISSASSMARYLKTKRLNNARRIVDFVDVDSQKWADYQAASMPPMSWVYAAESRRLRKLEKKICGWANVVTVVSEHEASLLRDLTGARNVHSVTNGVDLNYFCPATPGAESGCVFVGALDYLPNIDGIEWFARIIWPNVRLRNPEARLTIVGRKPTRAVLELRAVPGVDVVGQVPDVRPYLDQAAVVVAPLRIARGLQNKVLEAFATGKPVVASPVALAGFGDHPDLPACRANNSDDWIGILLELFENPDARRRLGVAGRAYAETHHNWSNCLTPFRDLLSLPEPLAVGGNP